MFHNYRKQPHPEGIPLNYAKLQQLTQATVIKHLIAESKLLLPSIIRISNIKTYLSLQTSQKTLIHFLCIFWQLNCLKIATFPTPGSFCWTRNPDIKHYSTRFAYRWKKKIRCSAFVVEKNCVDSWTSSQFCKNLQDVSKFVSQQSISLIVIDGCFVFPKKRMFDFSTEFIWI